MINFSEIQPGDLLKVLLNIDDVDDEMYAITKENRDDYLIVNYYIDTSKVYKGARVYEIDEAEELVQQENLCEHYPEGASLFTDIGNSMYCISEEIDDDMDSDIIDESDEESDLEDFIVQTTRLTVKSFHQIHTSRWIKLGMNGNQRVLDQENSRG
jgi:hypothetical protein